MAGDTFLTLTNNVLTHFNEVNLTSATFASATGFQAAAKNYVNNSIRKIQQSEYEWPFNWVERIDNMVGTLNIATLTLGTYDPNAAYPGLVPLATYVESVDWESFQVLRDDTIPLTNKKLTYVEYDKWNDTYRDQETAQIGTTLGNQTPLRVVRPQIDGYYIVSPLPTVAAKIKYEYWTAPVALSLYSDTTSIPQRFSHIIDDGSFAQAYFFRGNMQASNMYWKQQKDNIAKMRELLINQYKKVRDGRVRR